MRKEEGKFRDTRKDWLYRMVESTGKVLGLMSEFIKVAGQNISIKSRMISEKKKKNRASALSVMSPKCPRSLPQTLAKSKGHESGPTPDCSGEGYLEGHTGN